LSKRPLKMLTDGAVTISSGIEFQKFTIQEHLLSQTNGILASAILDYVHVFVFQYETVPVEAM